MGCFCSALRLVTPEDLILRQLHFQPPVNPPVYTEYLFTHIHLHSCVCFSLVNSQGSSTCSVYIALIHPNSHNTKQKEKNGLPLLQVHS